MSFRRSISLAIIAAILYFVFCVDIDEDLSLELTASEWKEKQTKTLKHDDQSAEDFTIVGTVDGFVHALDSNNQKKWSTSTGGSMISSHQTSQNNQRDYSIIPSIDGSLLVHSSQGMRKTSVKARMLADKTPFVSSDGELIFTGHKRTKVIGLDVHSGTVTHEIVEGQSLDTILPENTDDKPPLWIGRVDYTVRAFDGVSGAEQFNLSYTEIKPLHQSRLAQHEAAIMNSVKLSIEGSKGVITKDTTFPRLPYLSQKPKKESHILTTQSQEKVYHAVHFDSPAMTAFRIRKREDENGYDVESLKVINKAFDSSHLDFPDESEVIEIRTAVDGGYYALQTERIDLSEDDANNLKALLQSSATSKLHFLPHDAKKLLPSKSNTGKSINSVQLYSKQPFRSSLPLSRGASIYDWDKSVDRKSGGDCLTYPRSFKNTDEIDDTTMQVLLDSKEYDTAMCLVGHHILIPGQTNDLPFLPAEEEYRHAYHERSPSLYSYSRQSFNRISKVLIPVILLVTIYVIFNLKKLKRYLKAWITEFLAHEEIGFAADTSSLSMKSIGSDYSETFDESGRKVIKVGALVVYDKILGYGSHGTVVFNGDLNGRPVAVKRMLSQFSRVADREMSLLIRSDGHPNVVRYFLKEEKGDFIYLALQLCCMSLRDFVVQVSKHQNHTSDEDKNGSLIVSDEIRLGLHQIAKGVAHLHSHRIVHRDLKPHNILCALPDERANADPLNIDSIKTPTQLNDFVLKISDMGLSKQLDRDEVSFSMVQSIGSLANLTNFDESQTKQNDDENGHVGTVGWQAPELIMIRKSSISIKESKLSEEVNDIDEPAPVEEETVFIDEMVVTTAEMSSTSSIPKNSSPSSSTKKRTQTVDIFSLGCIFYYVLIPGYHPFGSWHEREANIINDNPNLSAISNNFDIYDLISRMIQNDPLLRPSAEQVHRHPFFWTSQQRLEFLIELSDRLEHEEPDSLLVLSIESNASDIIGSSWDRRLHTSLLDDIGKYRKYDKSCVRDLLRLIRNKKHHFHELDDQLKALMLPIPQGFLDYFENKFPKLFMHCVKVVCSLLSTEKHFSSLCEGIASLFSEKQSSNSSVAPSNKIENGMNVNSPMNDGSMRYTSMVTPTLTYDLIYPADSTLLMNDTKPGNSPMSYSESELIVSYTDNQSLLDQNVIVWYGSALADKFRCKAWLRDSNSWTDGIKFGASLKAQSKPRPGHLTRASQDFRYRSRLCTHWELTGGTACPMRKKGKCDFAHGPLELRIKDTRRDRWGKIITEQSLPPNYTLSGGEDVLGAARSVEKLRASEGAMSPYEKLGHNSMMNGIQSSTTVQTTTSMIMGTSNGNSVATSLKSSPFKQQSATTSISYQQLSNSMQSHAAAQPFYPNVYTSEMRQHH